MCEPTAANLALDPRLKTFTAEFLDQGRRHLGCDVKQTNRADHHVTHAVVDEWILAGLLHDGIKDSSLSWRYRIS
jgi:hypothetical protein